MQRTVLNLKARDKKENDKMTPKKPANHANTGTVKCRGNKKIKGNTIKGGTIAGNSGAYKDKKKGR